MCPCVSLGFWVFACARFARDATISLGVVKICMVPICAPLVVSLVAFLVGGRSVIVLAPDQALAQGDPQPQGQDAHELDQVGEAPREVDVPSACRQSFEDRLGRLFRRDRHGHGEVVAFGQRRLDEAGVDDADVDALMGQVESQRLEKVAQCV